MSARVAFEVLALLATACLGAYIGHGRGWRSGYTKGSHDAERRCGARPMRLRQGDRLIRLGGRRQL